MDNASNTKMPANTPTTQGFCNAVDSRVPDNPARTPAMVYAIAMPRTYIAERANPRSRVTLLPWPAINPERMGIMGRTQGVNDRSKPKPMIPILSGLIAGQGNQPREDGNHGLRLAPVDLQKATGLNPQPVPAPP